MLDANLRAPFLLAQAAMPALMRSAAAEYGPGRRTDQRALPRALPPGRRAEPAEIARTIALLASLDTSFVAGSVLHADGGALA
ncbi:SDR family oxidoreductase [Micromonospora sp. LOL_015]|uniref:SDR family oxidoreductase n=1 Tax=Micromonospora sp. LOL_015 TaxID=3345416 RepID=UPI003A8B2AB8